MYDKPISHSSRKLFKKCPRQWHDKYINGNRTEPGVAAARGKDVHFEIEQFFKARRALTNPALNPWRRALEALTVEQNGEAEKSLGRDAEWNAVPFEAPNAYFRGQLDRSVLLPCGTRKIQDWKTGRVYDDHREQGEDYIALEEPADRYLVEFWYIDQPTHVVTFHYGGNTRAGFVERIKSEVEKIRKAEEFPPTPSNFNCRYCPLSWRNGGECEAAP